jgi:tetratricopeptide (TPR) repeat protein
MERNVLSIVAEIQKRQLAKAREVAESARRREPLAAVEAAEMMQQLDELDFDRALAELAAVDDPEAIEAAAGLRCMRALRACERGDVEAGLAEWEAVIAAHPTLSVPFILRGRWWLQRREDTERALADFERAVAVDPSHAAAYRWRGRCFELRDDVERALANYRRAAALGPDDVDTQHAVALALSEHGVHDEALTAWTRLVALEPKYVDFWAGLARERAVAGEHEAALAAYDRAIELAPEDELLQMDRLTHLMQHFPPQQMMDRVIDEIERLAAKLPELAADAAPLHVERAIAHARAERIQEAFDEASRAVELDPTLAKACMIRGIYRTALDHEPALAIADMDRAVELAPNDAAAHFQRGTVLRWMDDMAGALAECDQAIALAPEVGRLYWERACWRHEANPWPPESAKPNIADYDRALEKGYREAEVFLYKADTFASLGRVDDAIATCDAAAAEFPEDGCVFAWRAEYKRRIGDTEGARADDAIAERLGYPSIANPERFFAAHPKP